MAEITAKTQNPNCIKTKARGTTPKASPKKDAGTSPPNPTQQLIFVRYLDHVLYNRSPAIAMKPQTRDAIGWLVYNCEQYLVLSWDRDAEPPTLHGGDSKASGLVLLKNDILDLQRLDVHPQSLPENYELNLKSKQHKEESEFALQPKKRKTQREAMAT
jgi:hypothetical protein